MLKYWNPRTQTNVAGPVHEYPSRANLAYGSRNQQSLFIGWPRSINESDFCSSCSGAQQFLSSVGIFIQGQLLVLHRMMNGKMMPIDDNSHLWTWLSKLDMFGVFLLTVNTVLFMSKKVLKFHWCIKETSIYDCGLGGWVIKTWKSSFKMVFYFRRCICDLIIEKT